MTGDQRHKNDTTFGQRVSRHSLPTLLCFNFFPTAQNILKFYANRTFGTFAFAPTHKDDPSAKAKEPNLQPHRMTFVPRTSIFLRILTNYNLIIAARL